MDAQINAMLEKVPARTGSGKYLDQLSEQGREQLDRFEKWLVEVDTKAASTAAAYKGYVAKAVVELEADPDFELDTDVKSAIGALRRFQTWLIEQDEAGQPASSLDEDADEPTG